MPRLKGFRNEDYELAQDVDRAAGVELGTTRPSKACDAAEKWILIKLRARAKMMWDKGYRPEARELYNFCYLLESGGAVSGHQIAVEAPLRYPGGKDGTYQSTCSCGRYSSGYGYPTPEAALKPAKDHKEAKEAQGVDRPDAVD